MADFRKWLFAFAVLALLLCVGTPAHAQTIIPTGFTCVANSGVPPFVRTEGVTELVGDVVIACTGGVPALNGAPIPQSNIQVLLNTQITSRILSATTNLSEATILIDEPYPGTATQVPGSPVVAPGTSATTQFACAAINMTNCAMLGDGGGQGIAGPYNGLATNPLGLATPGYNVFQGEQVSANQVDWLGVPIDAPGTTGAQRIIRITNIRGNICNLSSGASSFIPFPVSLFISINGTQQVTLSNPQVTVAFLAQGLKGTTAAAAYQQCYSLNAGLLAGTGGVTAASISLTATEGFASSFKVRSYSQIVAAAPATPAADSPASLQNVPGFPYNTESGFVATPTLGPGATAWGIAPGDVGLADSGTEITFTISNVPAGVSLFATLTTLPLFQVGTTSGATGEAILVAGSTTGGQLNVSGGSASVTYEVVQSNVNEFEYLSVPITVAFVTTGPTSPAPNTSAPATVAINFAPAAGTNTTAAAEPVPIPRFCQPYTPAGFFTINACSCNLLFPFVTNQAGFDTGVAIANTTADTLNGVAPQAGPVTLTYYGTTTGGGAAPATQISQSVIAGSELIFTLSGGGNLGITATPGFEGYIIARTNFQYCHAFAFISDMGAQKLAEGYLAIQLDVPVVTVNPLLPTGLNRTGQAGENQGH